jgi:Zn-dependent protease
MKHGQCDKHINYKGNQPVWRFGMDGKIIFKQILKKQYVVMLTGLIWFWRGQAIAFLNTALKLSYAKCGEFLD